MTSKIQFVPLARKKKPEEKFSFYVYVVMSCSTFPSSNHVMIDKIFRWKKDADKHCKEQNKQYGPDSHYVEKVGVK